MFVQSKYFRDNQFRHFECKQLNGIIVCLKTLRGSFEFSDWLLVKHIIPIPKKCQKSDAVILYLLIQGLLRFYICAVFGKAVKFF